MYKVCVYKPESYVRCKCIRQGAIYGVGSPGTNLAGSSNLAGSLPHELVINLGKVESNMAGIL